MGLFKSNNPFRHATGGGGQSSSSNVDDIAPPPGPPPSHIHSSQHQQQDFAPPPGPPPSHLQQQQQYQQQQQQGDYDPPSGPPPSYPGPGGGNYAPPPGPPPSMQQQQQQQHDWQSAVPDTALFPPPPALFSGYDRSTASNASEQDSDAGKEWCRRHPLAPPIEYNGGGSGQQWQSGSEASGDAVVGVEMVQPTTRNWRGTLRPKEVEGGHLHHGGGRVWSLITNKEGGDTCVIGHPPVYLVNRDRPRLLQPSTTTTRRKTIYYEVKILLPNSSHHHRFHRGGEPQNNKEGHIGLAIGFTALPYPPFRMPGWERASLAVHGDDGNRYVNDSHGGKEFTQPFRPGDTVGIGMMFSSAPSSYGKGRIEAEVFFTRNGKIDGKWDVHEELDATQDLPADGLKGDHDLAIAVGTFENVVVDIVLDPAKWMYRGVQ